MKALNRRSVADRLDAFTDKSGDCWVWTGGRVAQGYGRLRVNGKDLAAHRMAWVRASGPIPAGLLVCHRCDNRKCVRPDHLFLGTVADNNRDKKIKGGLRGYRIKLRPDDVREIRAINPRTRAEIQRTAKQFSVSELTIHRVVQRVIWSEPEFEPEAQAAPVDERKEAA